jgi:hypothetical protein
MKIINLVLRITALLWILYSSEMGCFQIKSVNNILERRTEKGGFSYRNFHAEALAKFMPSQSSEPSCTTASDCRNEEEFIFIAYRKSKILWKMLELKSIFVVSVDGDLRKEGVNRVVFSTPSFLTGEDAKGSPVFK